MPHDLWDFLLWLAGRQTILGLVRTLQIGSSAPLGCSSLKLRWFPHVQVLFNIQLKAWGELSVELWSCLSVRLSSLQFSALWTLAALASPDSLLRLLYAERQLGPCSLCCSLETLPRQKSAIIGLTSLVSPLSGVAILCCLMFNVWKLLFHVFYVGFQLLRTEGKLTPYIFLFPEAL